MIPAAVASPPEMFDTDFASAYLEGADEGLDFAEVRLTEYSSPGSSDLYVFITICDVKTDIWPEPPGFEPECWDTGFGDQVLDVDHVVFSTSQVRFTGDVEMFCTYTWLCDGQLSRMVSVSLSWDVDSSTHNHSKFTPFPGFTVWRNTWVLEMGGFTMSLDGLPIELEELYPTHLEGELEKTQALDRT